MYIDSISLLLSKLELRVKFLISDVSNYLQNKNSEGVDKVSLDVDYELLRKELAALSSSFNSGTKILRTEADERILLPALRGAALELEEYPNPVPSAEMLECLHSTLNCINYYIALLDLCYYSGRGHDPAK